MKKRLIGFLKLKKIGCDSLKKNEKSNDSGDVARKRCLNCKHCDLHDFSSFGLYYCLVDNTLFNDYDHLPPAECKHFIKN